MAGLPPTLLICCAGTNPATRGGQGWYAASTAAGDMLTGYCACHAVSCLPGGCDWGGALAVLLDTAGSKQGRRRAGTECGCSISCGASFLGTAPAPGMWIGSGSWRTACAGELSSAGSALQTAPSVLCARVTPSSAVWDDCSVMAADSVSSVAMRPGSWRGAVAILPGRMIGVPMGGRGARPVAGEGRIGAVVSQPAVAAPRHSHHHHCHPGFPSIAKTEQGRSLS